MNIHGETHHVGKVPQHCAKDAEQQTQLIRLRREMKEAVNWLRGDSRWIAIGAQSGRVVTVENAFVNPWQIPIGSLLPEEYRNAQIQMAREFAREMTQTGGR